jgi:hypothetical protein
VKSFADDKIDVYLGPVELGAADNLEQAIVDFIDGARKSLDIAVQEIDSVPIAEAIINARWKGVSINVFVEQDYIRTVPMRVPPCLPRVQFVTASCNLESACLQRVSVRCDLLRLARTDS